MQNVWIQIIFLQINQIKRANELTDSLIDTKFGTNKPTGDLELDLSLGKSQRTVNLESVLGQMGENFNFFLGSVRFAYDSYFI